MYFESLKAKSKSAVERAQAAGHAQEADIKLCIGELRFRYRSASTGFSRSQ
jgi:hypothetical protein